MIEERAILAALERIARMQDSIRSGMDICRDTGLVFLRVYYEQLPPNVARRLTELHAEDMAEIRPYVQEYARLFGRDADALLRDPYTVVTPGSSNPYQQMYVAN